MAATITILDSSRTPVAVLTGITAARLHERVNDAGTLTVETIERDLWPLIIPGTAFLRLRREDGSTMTFRIADTVISRTRERTVLTATTRGLLDDTAGEVVATAVTCLGYSPAALMAFVLGYSAFSPGVVEPTTVVSSVRFEYETVRECLARICRLCGGELVLDEATGEISLLERVGAERGAVFRYGVNLTGASRTISLAGMVNRVYAIGGGDPPLLVTGAAGSGGLPYVADTDSIAAWGLRAGVCQEPAIENVTNLVASPALDGDYTDGLCAGWSLSGTPVVERSSDPDTVLHGSASQRVSANAAGEGVGQVVTVTPGVVYSLFAGIVVETGSVRVQVVDANALYRREAPLTGTGYASIAIENWKAIGSTVTIQVVQEGDDPAVWCLDSVQLAAGATIKPFQIGSGADMLFLRAKEHLATRSKPDITYRVDLAGDWQDRRNRNASNGYGVGDTVRVIDPALGFDLATRVMERETDLLRPWRVDVRLDSPVRGMSDVVAAIREEQELTTRRQRALMTEQSRAAEEGSNRLGLSAQTLRFTGMVIADAWNRASWSAGTLRVGNAWYTVTAGTTGALPEQATRFVYFDRTTPFGFGCTADPDTAEGQDRIIVFAVTTTDVAEPCRIHPLGIIQK